MNEEDLTIKLELLNSGSYRITPPGSGGTMIEPTEGEPSCQ